MITRLTGTFCLSSGCCTNRGVRTNVDTHCAHSMYLRCTLYWYRSRGYNTFSCSTELSSKFQLLIKTKIPTTEKVSCFNLSLLDVVFSMLINVKMPTIVGILIFMSRINFVLS